MPIFLFWSQTDTDIFGFTTEPEGGNLPAEFAPWSKNGQGAALYLGAGEDLTAAGVANPVVRAIQRDGFYVGRGRFSPPTSRSVY
jgi:hypothetical protein